MNAKTEGAPPFLVRTIKERCRVCYTCVRECPAKAIRIVAGQAEVIQDRCIGCGNCVRVCSQNAKEVIGAGEAVKALLDDHAPVAACVAPSFPAEFRERIFEKNPGLLAGMLKALGFDYVIAVAFGADLVAKKYHQIFESSKRHHLISTACPAVVSYVEKYHPGLLPHLAPIMSPMLACGLVVKDRYGADVRTVFIGPCIAKKEEARRHKNKGAIDEVLTFSELRSLFHERHIDPERITPSDFDAPRPGTGVIFPVSQGLVQTAGLTADLLENKIVTEDGNKGFVEALKEYANKDLDVELLDILCCNGCIMGPGMTIKSTKYVSQARVTAYARDYHKKMDHEAWRDNLAEYETMDLTVNFHVDDKRLPVPTKAELRKILTRMGKNLPEDELNCGACGYETCIEHAIAIHKGLAENEMCLPYTIDKLKMTAKELSSSLTELSSTQRALMQSEKLASMGQLAAGIAHEVNNPLGVVLLYAHLLFDQCPEGSEMHDDLQMVVEQADRCKKIVGGLLNFARKNKTLLASTDINAIIGKCLNALSCPDAVKVSFEPIGQCVADIDPDQFTQVLINLFSNALEAMPDGGALCVMTESVSDEVRIRISDTGAGITRENRKRIFEPFFTTKQMGKGTGLGLAVTYGIIKMHHGQIDVQSNTDPKEGPTGTTFTIQIPQQAKAGREPDFKEAEHGA